MFRVVTLTMSPLDDAFLSGSLDKTIRLWDLRSQNCQVFCCFFLFCIFVCSIGGTVKPKAYAGILFKFKGGGATSNSTGGTKAKTKICIVVVVVLQAKFLAQDCAPDRDFHAK